MSKTKTLGEFIMDNQANFPFVTGQLTRVLTDIGVAAKIVNHQVNRAGLAGILGAARVLQIFKTKSNRNLMFLQMRHSLEFYLQESPLQE